MDIHHHSIEGARQSVPRQLILKQEPPYVTTLSISFNFVGLTLSRVLFMNSDSAEVGPRRGRTKLEH